MNDDDINRNRCGHGGEPRRLWPILAVVVALAAWVVFACGGYQ